MLAVPAPKSDHDRRLQLAAPLDYIDPDGQGPDAGRARSCAELRRRGSGRPIASADVARIQRHRARCPPPAPGGVRPPRPARRPAARPRDRAASVSPQGGRPDKNLPRPRSCPWDGTGRDGTGRNGTGRVWGRRRDRAVCVLCGPRARLLPDAGNRPRYAPKWYPGDAWVDHTPQMPTTTTPAETTAPSARGSRWRSTSTASAGSASCTRPRASGWRSGPAR